MEVEPRHDVRILKDRIPRAIGLSLLLHLAAILGAGFTLSEKAPPMEFAPYMVHLVSLPAPAGAGDKKEQAHEEPRGATQKTATAPARKQMGKQKPEPALQAASPQKITLDKEVPPAVGPETSPIASPGQSEEQPDPGHAEEGTRGTDGNASNRGAATGEPAGSGPVESAFGTKDGPRFISKFPPRYPRVARDAGKEGIVVLRLTIDEQGNLTDVEVVERAGSGFDEAAVRAVKNSRFSPAKKNGEATACKALFPVRFVLEGNQGG